MHGVTRTELLAGFAVLRPVDNGKLVHGLGGLVGDDCKNKSAEKCDAEAGGQHDVARRKG